MLRMTIAKKLIAGFGLVLVLLAGVAAVGLLSNSRSGGSLEEVNAMIEDTGIGADSAVEMLMVRMNVKDFLIRNDEKDVQEYNDWKNKLIQNLEFSDQNFQNPGRRERLAKIDGLFKQYDATFSEVQNIIYERNSLRRKVLDVVGKQATDNIKDAEYALLELGEVERVAELMPALLDILEGRLYVIKFMDTSAESDYERASKELNSSLTRLATFTENPVNAQIDGQLAEAAIGLKQYIDTFSRVYELVLQRDVLVKDTLDKVGPDIAKLQLEIKKSLLTDSDTESDEALDAIATANQMILLASGIAFLMGVVATFLIYRGTVTPLRAVINRVGEIAEGDGDLTQRVDDQRGDELGELGSKLNAFITKTHDIIFTARQASHEVASAATELSATTEEMSASMNLQTEQVGEIRQAIEEMSGAVVDVARKAADASSCASKAGDTARDGGHVVNQTIEGMNAISVAVSDSARSVEELGKRGEQIGEIIATINDIADQTNLLALNAAIEAARAGEHGRGFAVVADEVRKLADRTTQATEEIGSSIEAIQTETTSAVNRMTAGTDQVGQGVDSAREAGRSLEEIVGSANEVAAMIHSIAAATEEQSATTEQITHNIETATSSIRQAADGAAQSSNAVVSLSQKAEELQTLIGQFKLAEQA
ncbi:MAG: methyl-accepting chemotaxis protein [Planctomycetota bacterium]